MIRNALRELRISLRVGFFLAIREIQRSNKWTTALIVFVMTLTFLNLVVVRGILVGLIQGSTDAFSKYYAGDLIISNREDKTFIANSPQIIYFSRSLPSVAALSPRYTAGGKLETGYRNKKSQFDVAESIGGVVAGIEPLQENAVTNLSSLLIEGEYLQPGDFDKILVGASLLYKYSPRAVPGSQPLKGVQTGSRVLLTLNGFTREVTVKGVVRAKVQTIDSRIFMIAPQVQQMLNRTSFGRNEISIKLAPGASPAQVEAQLINQGFEKYGKIQTADQALPSFLNDIKLTFGLLGDIIGAVSLVVASITIFIVIFVNAITRRKYIGILKGIGISGFAIEFSYIVQSLFFAITGTAIASILIFAFLKPYFTANPIPFPFSDGILVATPSDILNRALVLIVATIIAGYIPARIVVKGKTLDAILGR